MEKLIGVIQRAVIEGASSEDRHAGADACRTILAALDVAPGQALAVTPQASPNPFAQLAQLDTGQVLDLVIAKLRTMVPAEATPTTLTARFQVPLLTPPRGVGRVR